MSGNARLPSKTPTTHDADLWAMPVQHPYNPHAKRIGEMMQADLAKIGVKTEIKTFLLGRVPKAGPSLCSQAKAHPNGIDASADGRQPAGDWGRNHTAARRRLNMIRRMVAQLAEVTRL